MSGKPFLFWGSGSIPCWKAMIVLQEKGIEYDEKIVSFSKQEHKGDDVKKLNPRGQVPTFKDADGTVVNESNAICFYLEQRYPDRNPLIPKDAVQCAKVLQRTFEASENMQMKLMLGIFYKFMTTKAEERDEAFQKTLEENKKNLLTELGVWEKYLADEKTKYIASNDFTMADVFFFPFMAWTQRLGLNLDKFPQLKKYFDVMMGRPSIKNTEPPHWKEGASSLTPLKDL